MKTHKDDYNYLKTYEIHNAYHVFPGDKVYAENWRLAKWLKGKHF